MSFCTMRSGNKLSLFCLMILKCFTPCRSDCLHLESHSYMNFVVRVWDKPQNIIWSTGSILTPNVVLGICTRDLSPRQDLREIRSVLKAHATDFGIRTSTAALPSKKVDNTSDRPYDVLSHHFSQGIEGVPASAPNVCSREYDVDEIFPHPWCQDKKIFQPSKYNMAAFIIKGRFDVKKGDLIPLMPISEDVQSTLRAIDHFNSKRRTRCQIAQFNVEMSSHERIKYPYKNQNAFRSVHLKSECVQVCLERYEPEDRDKENWAYRNYCKYLLLEPEGSMFCATRVSQEHYNEGMNYYDYYNLDNDFDFEKNDEREPHNLEKCAHNLDTIQGAPMLCDGIVLGFVVLCHKKTLVLTSVLTIRNFLLSLINSSYLPMIYLDHPKGNLNDERIFSDPNSDTNFRSVQLKMETPSSSTPLTHPLLSTAIFFSFASFLHH